MYIFLLFTCDTSICNNHEQLQWLKRLKKYGLKGISILKPILCITQVPKIHILINNTSCKTVTQIHQHTIFSTIKNTLFTVPFKSCNDSAPLTLELDSKPLRELMNNTQ